jgi:hypothetical protein
MFGFFLEMKVDLLLTCQLQFELAAVAVTVMELTHGLLGIYECV